uniref:Caspase n=1 Tax=Anopheles farauti TaxID=69004 RepID=A0A182QTG5_9DIPT
MEPPVSRSIAADELDTKPIVSDNKPKISATPRRSIVSAPNVIAAVMEENYNTTNSKRGTALIFNHVSFTDKTIREGSMKDCDSIERALKKLEFDVRIWTDETKENIIKILEKVAKEDHSDHDCLVVVVMTHGGRDDLAASDKSYDVEKLWKPFLGNGSPSLIGKPKLFFIQACRGTEVDAGVKVGNIVADTVDSSPIAELKFVIPTMADVLVMYSTYDGHYSWRNPVNGSWFIQALSDELESNAHRKELLQMLTTVSRVVAYQYQSNVPDNEKMDAKKQMPCVVSMLTRALYFPPK